MLGLACGAERDKVKNRKVISLLDWMGGWIWKWDGPMMGQVNGESTIEQKTMTVTGVPVEKKSDAGFDVDEQSVSSGGRKRRARSPWIEQQ